MVSAQICWWSDTGLRGLILRLTLGDSGGIHGLLNADEFS
jgi:hypothetical protein